MGIITVGGVLKKDNKYLLVQEAKAEFRGTWNLPAGRMDPNETVLDGAKREIREECGFEGQPHYADRGIHDVVERHLSRFVTVRVSR